MCECTTGTDRPAVLSVLCKDHHIEKMHFTLGLFLPLLLSLFSSTFANPIDPSDSLLPTKATAISSDPSRTWGASGAAGSYYCISPREHPDWAGTINFRDCEDAFYAFSDLVGNKGRRWTFWSGKYRSTPPPQSFKLPAGFTSGKSFSRSLSAFHFPLIHNEPF